MTCNLRTVNSVIQTVTTKQRNILSVDNEVQFTDHKLCLTDRQKRIRTVRTERTVRSINGPLQCGYIGQHSLKCKDGRKMFATNVITYCMTTTCEGGGWRNKSEWILTKKSTGNRKFMGKTMDRQHWYSALEVVYSSLTTRNSLQNPCQ